ncbi:MAG: Fic family protein [Nitrospinae bacterium]|nr:Fic family protein [Nitrospinota bacterium]
MKLPLTPPSFELLFNDAMEQGADHMMRILQYSKMTDLYGKYRHWDTLRHLPPPEGFSLNGWWLGMKWTRKTRYKTLPLADKNNVPFVIADPDMILRDLHLIDQRAAGNLAGDGEIINDEFQSVFLVKSLVNEAINSSQLEGAATTRKIAKEMLSHGRAPRDKSEQMIFNNYKAMQFIRERKGDALTPDLIFTLHRMLTEKTLDNPEDAGRLRKDSDKIVVSDGRDGELLHNPPAAHELPGRIDRLCNFANMDSIEYFIHPLVKAIILHFTIGYDHPFVDGNGRLARAIFYWYVISKGYWLMEYISISRIIKMAPAKYARAFLYSETDDNDLTYFAVHQLNVIKKAIRLLNEYIARQRKEISGAEDLLKTNPQLAGRLNYRQLSIIRHALRHPGYVYDIREHQRYQGVSYNSARTDLHDLADKFNIFKKVKIGKTYRFRAPMDIKENLSKAG